MPELHQGANQCPGLGRVADGTGERPIDLEAVNRESLEICERRVSRTEVVDCQLDSECLQLPEPSAVVSALRISAVSVTSTVSLAGSSPLSSKASRTSSTMMSWSS